MSCQNRLNKTFEGAARLPLNSRTKYVLISDCHRGVGTSNDNFLKNQNLYFAALQHYYRTGYTYIELGDGDELWENRSMEQIIEAHGNVFWLLSLLQRKEFLRMNRHWKLWWKAAGIRAVKTVAQTAAATIGTAAVLGDVNWPVTASAAVLAGLLSLLTSVAGLPEVDDGNG